jgi:FkbH-like protein
MIHTDIAISCTNKSTKKMIKCIIWDLDNTLWNGILLEDESVALRENVITIIKTFDGRGILQSIASKNDHSQAMEKLRDFRLEEYFLYPQINWNSKASSIRNIAKSIGIGLDTIAFIDDQPFEMEEVNFSLPQVYCINALDLNLLLNLPEMNPQLLTKDAKLRRQMYIHDAQRKVAEENFVGSQSEFLKTLNMTLTISATKEEDLQRAEELTVRTNQLNSNGYTYSYDELNYFSKSEQHKLLIASLDDKYGSYGKIGLAVIDCQNQLWTIKLLLMSCRVISRGVGTVMLNYIMNLAKDANVRLVAEFVNTGRNRMMYITYKFASFQEIEKRGDTIILETDLTRIQACPNYVNLQIVH